MKARGVFKQPEMNKTERAYSQELELRRKVGEIRWWRFEGWKFRLADNAYFCPDFVVMLADGFLEAHEVKGFWREAARARIKIAAEMYPVKFLAIKKSKQGWVIENF